MHNSRSLTMQVSSSNADILLHASPLFLTLQGSHNHSLKVFSFMFGSHGNA